MLKRFEVDNFKTHINTVFEPAPINLLIGKNNSGKTNLCKALQFLCLTAVRDNLNDAVNLAIGDLSSLPNTTLYPDNTRTRLKAYCDIPYDGGQISFTYELVLVIEPTKAYPMQNNHTVEIERLEATRTGSSSSLLIDRKGTSVSLMNEKDERAAKITSPPSETVLHRIFKTPENKTAYIFKEYLGFWQFYELDNWALRSVSTMSVSRILNPNGDNLATVLFNANNMDRDTYSKIEADLKEIDPSAQFLNFYPFEQKVYMSITDRAGKKLPLNNLSNGTLRFLALSHIIRTNPVLDKPQQGLSPLVVFEEPENGLHVNCLSSLLDLIEPDGTAGQFIFTTHSPLFIDQFEDNLDGLFLVTRSNSHSRIRSLNDAKVKTLLEDYSLSFLHFQDKLEQM